MESKNNKKAIKLGRFRSFGIQKDYSSNDGKSSDREFETSNDLLDSSRATPISKQQMFSKKDHLSIQTPDLMNNDFKLNLHKVKPSY